MHQSRRPFLARALVALFLAPAIALTTVGGAQAATRTMHDDGGDTYYAADMDSDAAPVRQASPVADIVSVRTAHSRKAVTVTVRAREITPGMNTGGVFLTTAKHQRFTVVGVGGGPFRFAILSRGVAGDHEVECDGLRMRFDVRHDTVRTTVPRSCLGSPRWVRTGAILMSPTDPGNMDSSAMSVDVAGMNEVSDQLWNDENAALPLGPKVRVG